MISVPEMYILRICSFNILLYIQFQYNRQYIILMKISMTDNNRLFPLVNKILVFKIKKKIIPPLLIYFDFSPSLLHSFVTRNNESI